MLYGLACSLLGEDKKALNNVSGIGGSYCLEVNLNNYGDIADHICDFVDDHENAIKTALSSNLTSLRDRIDVFIQTLTDVNEMTNYLQTLSIPGHSRNEGRGKHGTTIPLPLMPVAGKYLHKDLTLTSKFTPSSYNVCNNCLSLAALGLAEAAISIRARGQWSVVIIVIPFEGNVSPLYFSEFFEFKFRSSENIIKKLYANDAVNQIPVKVLTRLVFLLTDKTVLRSMSEMQAKWYALSVLLTGRANAPQVRGMVDIEISSFIRNLSLLYEKNVNITEIDRLLFFLASKGDVSALEGLFTFISNRDLRRFYQFTRETYSSIERWRKDPDPREKAQAENAAKCFSKCRNIAIELLC